tara:strand:+ start:437 stop:643 length:207 start_codon:yes stop_codon:yes gene_type:complete
MLQLMQISSILLRPEYAPHSENMKKRHIFKHIKTISNISKKWCADCSGNHEATPLRSLIRSACHTIFS